MSTADAVPRLPITRSHETPRGCQNQHDLGFADEVFHPEFVNHYRPGGQPILETARPASGFQPFYGAPLQAGV